MGDDSICLEWNRPEFDADRYQVYMKIADDKKQANVSNKWHLIYQGNETNYTVPNLVSDTEYLFRARYQCLYGMSPWPKAKKSKTLKNEKKREEETECHPPILSNIQIATKQKEQKKQQKKNRKENKKKKQNQENRRRKEAANKRRKKEAKQRAKEQKKREEEEEHQKKLELEAEEKRLYDQALIERLRQIELQKANELKIEKERERK